MENLSNSININNSIISQNGNSIDITKIYDSFKLNLQGDRIERENKLLLENNFIEPSILLSFNYSLEKLSILFERLKFRLMVIGTRNSHHAEFANCLIGKNSLFEVNNIILIVRQKPKTSEKSILYKCEINKELGFDFK